MNTVQHTPPIHIAPLADHVELLPVLADWLYREWGHLEPLSTREWVESRLAERTNRVTVPICFVALAEQSLVGTVSIKLREMEMYPQLRYWIGSLLVAPPWRRRGIGSALMHHACEWASGQTDTMHLYTTETQGFYETLGWSTIATPHYRGETVTVMHKQLGAVDGRY